MKLFAGAGNFSRDLIFTYIGPTLLVVNPYKFIPKLFNDQVLKEVKDKLNNDKIQVCVI